MPKKKEYIRGENVGPHKSIIFLAELPPMKKRRRALFHCNQCNKTFESDIAEVNRGKKRLSLFKNFRFNWSKIWKIDSSFF